MSRPLLVLIDLQKDFLERPRLDPHPDTIVAAASYLLRQFRERGLPVAFVRTVTTPGAAGRMPHWEQQGISACAAGSAGAEMPAVLDPRDDEAVFDKIWFSAFSVAGFEEFLRKQGIDTLVLAGLFIQSCLRQTALDAYQKGYRVYLAREASGTHDPLHGALTLNYLADRSMTPLDTPSLFTALTDEKGTPVPKPLQPLDHLVADLREVQTAWMQQSMLRRVACLRDLAAGLVQEKENLARLIVDQVRKPITLARGEVDRAVALLHAVSARAENFPSIKTEAEGRIRYHPRGVVALITPWNNPLAIPMGKLAPALVHGNAVIWKPSPYSAKIAHALPPLLRLAGFPERLVTIVEGDERQARNLIAANVDAVAFSGSSRTGWSIIAQASARLLPVQAELGGNNGAIICSSADLATAAEAIAEGAFGFAGQRCTSNRRVIVISEIHDAFLRELEKSTRRLPCGDPLKIETRVPPMISAQAAQAVAGLVERARAAGFSILQFHSPLKDPTLNADAFHPPTIILCNEPDSFIVQEESFGPILVVQKARDFAHALELLNYVPQGLVAALFSQDQQEQEAFLLTAQAGILKLNVSTVNVGVDLPLTGWKHSGYGAAEHGEANAEFFTKRQAIYG